MIRTDVINDFNETAHDRRITSKETSHDARADSEATHVIILIAQAFLDYFALEIDVHVEFMNIHELARPHTECHVSDVEAHSIHLQISNVLHHYIRSG